ncbi:hypothetical protein T11_13230 [Trichinella zimbabwensis]|uniref:Uncharacterized protein n=1 Tax=Trichinella zimbabwensis TaxID=268475 RepID=A0A0V1G872_9BILA|nr:hypothetical protein T11_13230 [Trichinella zimbabwensis]
MDHSETTPPGDLFHSQPPNADTISYARPPMEKLEKVPKELKGSTTL